MELNSLSIRSAVRADVDLIIRLRLDYLRSTDENLSNSDKERILAQLQTYFPSHLGESFHAQLAFLEETIVSCAFLVIDERPANPSFISGRVGTILNVFTYPAYRRQGIGGKVVSAIIAVAKENQVARISLKATSSGKPLYEKLGFHPDNQIYTNMTLKL